MIARTIGASLESKWVGQSNHLKPLESKWAARSNQHNAYLLLLEKVPELLVSLKINFLHIEGCLTLYISRYLASDGHRHKTANIVPEIATKNRQNVHLVHYHIDECQTDQIFSKVMADVFFC